MEKLKIKRRIKNKICSVKVNENHIILMAISMLCGFIGAFGKILGFSSYMNVAVAALSGTNPLPSFIGSIIAYLINGSLGSSVVQICSILIISAIKLIVPMGEKHDDPIFLSLITSGTLMLFGCVMSLAMPSDTYTTSMRMISAVLCGCTVFIIRSIMMCREENGVFDMTGINGIFAAAAYVLIISTLTAVPLFIFNPGRIIGTAVMLMAVRRYKNMGGAVIGALTTCGVLLCTPSLAGNTLLLATSGMICGIFMTFGNLFMIIIFLILSIISMVAIGINSDTFHMFADLIAGSMIYISLPVSWVKKTAKKFVGVRGTADTVGQATAARLGYASKTLGDIRGQLSMVTAAMDKRTKEQSISNGVEVTICEYCELKDICDKNNIRREKGFYKLEETLMKFNCVSKYDVMQHCSWCIKPEKVSRGFNEVYENMLAARADNIKLREMREFVTCQLSGVEDILGDLSFRVGQVRTVDAALSTKVRDYFSNLGYPNAKVCVYIDEGLCQRVEVYLTSEFHGDPITVTTAVSELIEYDLDLPVITTADGVTKLVFAEIADYYAHIESFCASSSGEYSGDTFDIVDLNGNEKYVILSDGMGTGKRARLDSVFSVNLVSRLLSCGISPQTAHKMINLMLMVKGWEESFATLDLLRLDLGEGYAEILKSGSAPSYLCRDGGMKIIDTEAFPAGILPDCQPDITSMKLFDKDIILMVSDGVEQTAVREFSDYINSMSLEDAVCRLGSLAISVCNNNKPDDITIIAVEIGKKK